MTEAEDDGASADDPAFTGSHQAGYTGKRRQPGPLTTSIMLRGRTGSRSRRGTASLSTYHHPSDERHRLIGRAEQVIADGSLLDQVLAAEDMEPGTFLADMDNGELLMWLPDGGDPSDREMEASTRQLVFGHNPWTGRGEADHIHLGNVTIRYAANHAQCKRRRKWEAGGGARGRHSPVV